MTGSVESVMCSVCESAPALVFVGLADPDATRHPVCAVCALYWKAAATAAVMGDEKLAEAMLDQRRPKKKRIE